MAQANLHQAIKTDWVVGLHPLPFNHDKNQRSRSSKGIGECLDDFDSLDNEKPGELLNSAKRQLESSREVHR